MKLERLIAIGITSIFLGATPIKAQETKPVQHEQPTIEATAQTDSLFIGPPIPANQPYIEIDLSENKLYFHANPAFEDSTFVYSVATGKKEYRTPIGEFNIIDKVKDPSWGPSPSTSWLTKNQSNYIKTKGGYSGTDPRNPLGGYWLKFTEKGHGIHGTNNEKSIGTYASHGCVRMKRSDIQELFDKIYEGMRVVVKE